MKIENSAASLLTLPYKVEESPVEDTKMSDIENKQERHMQWDVAEMLWKTLLNLLLSEQDADDWHMCINMPFPLIQIYIIYTNFWNNRENSCTG